MDNASICSDDTDVLINASSSHFGDITSTINFKSDRYLLTEKYVSENLTESNHTTRPETLHLGRKHDHPRQYGLSRQQPNSFTDARLDFTPYHSAGVDVADSSQNSADNLRSKYSTQLRISPPLSWRNEHYTYTSGTGGIQVQHPSIPTSIMKSNNPSPPKSVTLSCSTSPKSVKFEEPTRRRFSSVSTDQPSHLSVADLDSVTYEKTVPEFDTVDEKVKEGKEILARLLDSTKSMKYEPRVENNTNAVGCASEIQLGEVQLVTSDREEAGTFTMSQTGSMLQSKDLRDPVFTSTRTDMSDEKPAFDLREISGTMHEEDIASEKKQLIREIKELKEELSRYQVNSFMEVKSLRVENEKMVGKLQGQISNLNKQKTTLEEYVNQMKLSLSKKNDRCSELQEQLHEKLTLIHQMTNTANKERCSLESQVVSLQEKKKTLQKQVEKMEISFQSQLDEIKEVEKRFESEKHDRDNKLLKKNQEIAFLHHQIESLTQKNSSREVELKSDIESQIERAVLRGKNVSQSQVNDMKLSLDNELERHLRLESKHQAEVRSLKANFETLKTINVKLKKELETCLEENHQLEKTNAANTKHLREEAELEADMLRKKIISFEKVQRSMALELIEESTKLAVVCGTTPTTSTRQDAFVDCNVLSEAMVVFKEHLEAFRHHVLVLSQNKQLERSLNNSDSNENTVPNTNVQTSAKLLRHLQNRVQQLRKENAMLRENSVCESCQGEINALVSDKLENAKTVGGNLGEIVRHVSPVRLVNLSGDRVAQDGSYIETITNNAGTDPVTSSPKYKDRGPLKS